jgi:transposase
MDRASDRQAIRPGLAEQGVAAVIPGKTNRLTESAYDKEPYRLRQKVARFFHKLNQGRRIATRDDQRSRTWLALIHRVGTGMLIRSCVNPT